MNRHITIITTATAEAIDDAITEALRLLNEKHSEAHDLVNVATLHRPHDGALFVTVIAARTGQVRAVAKPKKPKEQTTNE